MSNFYSTSTSNSSDENLKAARIFFDTQGEAVQQASLLLGGPTADRRSLRLLSNLRDAPGLSRHLKQELVLLHRLLTLDAFGEQDEIESELSLQIHPEDPIVEDVCLLADSLFDLLEQIGARSEDQESSPEQVQKQNAA